MTYTRSRPPPYQPAHKGYYQTLTAVPSWHARTQRSFARFDNNRRNLICKLGLTLSDPVTTKTSRYKAAVTGN
jgi:hypothetical protein